MFTLVTYQDMEKSHLETLAPGHQPHVLPLLLASHRGHQERGGRLQSDPDQVLVILTNERRVLGVLTNERRVLPVHGDGGARDVLHLRLQEHFIRLCVVKFCLNIQGLHHLAQKKN